MELAAILILDISFYYFKRGSASREHAVCPIPQYGFPVVFFEFTFELTSDFARANCFECVYEFARLDVWMSINEQVYMVTFAIVFGEFAACIFANSSKVVAQTFQDWIRKSFVSVLSDKDYVVEYAKYAVCMAS